MTPAATPSPLLSLYVHLPWCVRKCPYCDFNSHRAPEELPIDAYVTALIADLDRDLADMPELAGRRIDTVFFGGGTPSLFPATAIGTIIEQANARLAFTENVEITLEANPGTIERGRFHDYRRAGVNRISLGVQSFDNTMLQRLGRIHDGDQALRAAREVREAGIDNLNLDLMYALPEQDLDGALADLDAALALAPEHLSHYQLTLEPHTEFARRPPPLPDNDLAAEMMIQCQARLADAGWQHYETSAYARPGRACRHNLNYWRYGDYLGIGAGAHGKLTLAGQVRRRWKQRHPKRWQATAGSAQALGGDDAVAVADLPFDYALNALRLHEGFTSAQFSAATGLPLAAIVNTLMVAEQRGLIEIRPVAGQAGREQAPTATGVALASLTAPMQILPSAHGRHFLNDLLELFLPEQQPTPAASSA
ncbi:MAG: radical SAM family heme chaperone HemW [Xanthomonadales bacterium]|nr:radical SAM family heme chaperone HemW [Xanthomonadales bacterium]